MMDALAQGVERILIGLGGSATLDGGMGCMGALGVKLLDGPVGRLPRAVARWRK